MTNVLAAKQLEAGALAPAARVVFSPRELVDNVLQACRPGCPTAGAGGITAERAAGDFLPALAEGDRDRIAQVLQNLGAHGAAAACVQCARSVTDAARCIVAQ